MKKFLYIILAILVANSAVLANRFFPEFDQMRTYRCDISETTYNADNTVVSTNNYFRIFHLDDENMQIYLQKAPVDRVLEYNNTKIELTLTTLADEYMMNSAVTLDRAANSYYSETNITYDNPIFGNRKSIANGSCKYLD